MATITGTDRGERLVGTAEDDGILGLGGDDGLFGLDGNDKLLGGDGNDYLEGGLGADILDGGDGVDTASYRHAAGGVGVDLANGFGRTGEALGDQYDSVENVIGSAFADVIVGSGGANRLDGGGADDILIGGNGNDVLIGGARSDTLDGGSGRDVLISGTGSDTMTGGAEADRFVYSMDDLHFGDRITDFNRVAGDLIDLSAIDADTVEAGDQAFVFIGTAAFSQRAGELHYVVIGADAVAAGDVDGDGVADFKIALHGLQEVRVEDFVL